MPTIEIKVQRISFISDNPFDEIVKNTNCDHRLSRHNVEIDGNAAVAHYVYDHKEFSGIVIPDEEAGLPSPTRRTPRP